MSSSRDYSASPFPRAVRPNRSKKYRAGRSRLVESLEPRQLLTVTLAPGQFTVLDSGNAAPDQYDVVLLASSSSASVQLSTTNATRDTIDAVTILDPNSSAANVINVTLVTTLALGTITFNGSPGDVLNLIVESEGLVSTWKPATGAHAFVGGNSSTVYGDAKFVADVGRATNPAFNLAALGGGNQAGLDITDTVVGGDLLLEHHISGGRIGAVRLLGGVNLTSDLAVTTRAYGRNGRVGAFTVAGNTVLNNSNFIAALGYTRGVAGPVSISAGATITVAGTGSLRLTADGADLSDITLGNVNIAATASGGASVILDPGHDADIQGNVTVGDVNIAAGEDSFLLVGNRTARNTSVTGNITFGDINVISTSFYSGVGLDVENVGGSLTIGSITSQAPGVLNSGNVWLSCLGDVGGAIRIAAEPGQKIVLGDFNEGDRALLYLKVEGTVGAGIAIGDITIQQGDNPQFGHATVTVDIFEHAGNVIFGDIIAQNENASTSTPQQGNVLVNLRSTARDVKFGRLAFGDVGDTNDRFFITVNIAQAARALVLGDFENNARVGYDSLFTLAGGASILRLGSIATGAANVEFNARTLGPVIAAGLWNIQGTGNLKLVADATPGGTRDGVISNFDGSALDIDFQPTSTGSVYFTAADGIGQKDTAAALVIRSVDFITTHNGSAVIKAPTGGLKIDADADRDGLGPLGEFIIAQPGNDTSGLLGDGSVVPGTLPNIVFNAASSAYAADGFNVTLAGGAQGAFTARSDTTAGANWGHFYLGYSAAGHVPQSDSDNLVILADDGVGNIVILGDGSTLRNAVVRANWDAGGTAIDASGSLGSVAVRGEPGKTSFSVSDTWLAADFGSFTVHNGNMELEARTNVPAAYQSAINSNVGSITALNGTILDAEVTADDGIARVYATHGITGQFAAPNGSIGAPHAGPDGKLGTADDVFDAFYSETGNIEVAAIAGGNIGNLTAVTGTILGRLVAVDLTADGATQTVAVKADPPALDLQSGDTLLIAVNAVSGELRAGGFVGTLRAQGDIGNYAVIAGGSIGDVISTAGSVGVGTTLDLRGGTGILRNTSALANQAGLSAQIAIGALTLTAAGSVGAVKAYGDVGGPMPLDTTVNGIRVTTNPMNVTVHAGGGVKFNSQSGKYEPDGLAGVFIGIIYSTTGNIHIDALTSGSVGVFGTEPTGGISAPQGSIYGALRAGGDFGGTTAGGSVNLDPFIIVGQTGVYRSILGGTVNIINGATLPIPAGNDTYLLKATNITSGVATYSLVGDQVRFTSITLNGSGPVTLTLTAPTYSNITTHLTVKQLTINGDAKNIIIDGDLDKLTVNGNLRDGSLQVAGTLTYGSVTGQIGRSGNLKNVVVKTGAGFGRLVSKGTNFGLKTVTLRAGQYLSLPSNVRLINGTPQAWVNLYLRAGVASLVWNNGQIERITLNNAGTATPRDLLVVSSSTPIDRYVTVGTKRFYEAATTRLDFTPTAPMTTTEANTLWSRDRKQYNHRKWAQDTLLFLATDKSAQIPTSSTYRYYGTTTVVGQVNGRYANTPLTNLRVFGSATAITFGKSAIGNGVVVARRAGRIATGGNLSNVTVRGDLGSLSALNVTTLRVSGNADNIAATRTIRGLQAAGHVGILTGNYIVSSSVAGSALRINANYAIDLAIQGCVGVEVTGAAVGALALGNGCKADDLQRIFNVADHTTLGDLGPHNARFVGGLFVTTTATRVSVGGLLADLTFNAQGNDLSALVGHVLDDAYVGVDATNAFVKTDGELIQWVGPKPANGPADDLIAAGW